MKDTLNVSSDSEMAGGCRGRADDSQAYLLSRCLSRKYDRKKPRDTSIR